MTDISTSLARIRAGADWLDASLVQRRAVVDALILAATAGEHLFLFGPPGVAKSLALRNFRALMGGSSYFEVLMTRFTMPEEIWGPLSTTGLREDRYRRNLAGRLADVELAFLDEVFKANSAILNSLLTLLNERVFHDDGVAKSVPLRTMIAASNEVPSDDSGLDALADRLVLRLVVSPVEGAADRDAVTWDDAPDTYPDRLTWEDFDAVRAVALGLPAPSATRDCLRAIVDDVRAAGITVSDRRVKKAAKLARCAAALAGSPEVATAHLDVMRNVLWNKPAEALVVGEVVDKHASAWLVEVRRLNGVVAEVETAIDGVKGDRVQRMMALNEHLKRLDELRDALSRLRGGLDPRNANGGEAIASISLAEAKARAKATKALVSSAEVR